MSYTTRLMVTSALCAMPGSIVSVTSVAAQDLAGFAVISGQSLTNTGPTTIIGNIAVSPGTSYTGSGSVTQIGDIYIGDAVSVRIQNDLASLYPILAGRPTSAGGDLTGQDLGGMTLSAGVYNFDTSAGLAAGQTLTLDAGGNPDAIFIFNIGSTFIAESGSSVVLENGAQGGNVFYRVGSSATLNTSAQLQGQIVALTSITMNTSAGIACGAAFARNGSVTLDTNTIQICTLAARGFDTVVDNPLLTEPDRAIALALSDYVANGGVLPIGFAILAATQTPEELAASLEQLSGEVTTGLAPLGFDSMDAFLDVVVASGHRPRAGVMAPRDVGVPVGMVPDKINAPYTGKYGSAEPEPTQSPLAYPAAIAELSRPWDVWASGYGAHSVVEGDALLGQRQRTSTNRGLAAGLNFAPNARQDFGIALSWNTADFALAEAGGHGNAKTASVALRGRTSTDRAYLEGAIAFGHSDISTERTLTIAGVDRLVGETTANTIAAHVEAGYSMGIFTPFIGLRAQSFTSKAFSETAAAGSSSYALRYDDQTATSVRSELGVDLQWDTARAAGGVTSVGLRAAWAHEFASNPDSTAAFLSVPGVAIPISGATADRDSLILAANLRLASARNVYLDASVNGEYSQGSQDVGGSVTIGYRW